MGAETDTARGERVGTPRRDEDRLDALGADAFYPGTRLPLTTYALVANVGTKRDLRGRVVDTDRDVFDALRGRRFVHVGRDERGPYCRAALTRRQRHAVLAAGYAVRFFRRHGTTWRSRLLVEIRPTAEDVRPLADVLDGAD